MKIDLSKVLIGSDFELFIKSQDKFISALAYIDGTKDSPQVITEMGHAIQADGALFEANVPPVALDAGEEMWNNIQFVIDEGKSRLPKDYTIVCCPNGEFDDSELADPRAQESGCTPDFCAWKNGEINEKPILQDTNKRCCGAHLHISFPGASPRMGLKLVKLLDLYLAVPLILIDTDKERRKLYGKAGCFRFKDYGSNAGIEYRSLSNAAIKDKETFLYVWEQLTRALKDFNEGVNIDAYGDEIQSAINDYNELLAIDLCDRFHINIPYELQD